LGEAISQLDEGKLFLEIGFGGAENLRKVAAGKFEEVVGTDTLPIKNFPACVSPKIELLRADRATCFRDGVFDVVAFNPPYLPSDRIDDRAVDGGLHGMEIPLQFLDSAMRVVKREGKVLILLSSLSEKEIFSKYCSDNNLFEKKITEKKFFFETLTVYLVTRQERSTPQRS